MNHDMETPITSKLRPNSCTSKATGKKKRVTIIRKKKNRDGSVVVTKQ